jgi:hypothetical protein
MAQLASKPQGMETRFGRAARALDFTAREMEMFAGSLLGDATLLETSSGYCFRVHHGLSQRYFVDWKHRAFQRFVRTPPRISGKGYYFRTVTHPGFSVLRRAFYHGNRKVVPIDYLDRHLGGLGLAIWIMDDGAADGGQLRINTPSFTVAENQALAALLERKFGLKMTLNYDKGRPRLRCRAMSMKSLVGTVREHVLPEMHYKLSPIA